MSRHPAPEELLLDYAAGTLAEGPSLAVALHCALDPAAQRAVDRLDALGGAMLDAEDTGAADERELSQVLATISGLAVEKKSAQAPLPKELSWAPRPLHRYLRNAGGWRKKLGGFEEITLPIAGQRVSLLRLEPGRGLPVHRHVGTEYTVCLQGGYSDATGHYGPGDFAVGPGENEHMPVADAGPACIALIVLEKPIVLTGPVGRLFNPLVRRGII